MCNATLSWGSSLLATRPRFGGAFLSRHPSGVLLLAVRGLRHSLCWQVPARHPKQRVGGGGRLAGNDPIHAPAIRLLGLQPEGELLAHQRRQKTPAPRELPAGGSHDRRDGGAARPAPELRPSAPQLKRE
jgi:hypothetical protein